MFNMPVHVRAFLIKFLAFFMRVSDKEQKLEHVMVECQYLEHLQFVENMSSRTISMGHDRIFKV